MRKGLAMTALLNAAPRRLTLTRRLHVDLSYVAAGGCRR
jgi:hypothetical protein